MIIKLILRVSLFTVLFSFSYVCYAQFGGQSSYSFLEKTNSARAGALGNHVIAIQDNDINLAYHNPSLLNENYNQQITLNYVNYYSDINISYAGYSFHSKKLGTFAVGIHYINYGDFTETDENYTEYGSFTASDYALNILYAVPLGGKFSGGINVKPLYSTIERYNSFGIAVDMGITLDIPEKNFTAALVAKNMGQQITTYHDDTENEKLPFDIQFGVSKKLQYAPFRLMATFHSLNKWDLTYDNDELSTNQDMNDNNSKSTLEKIPDQFLRHLIIGVELLPFESFSFRLGYDYRKRQEMKIETRPAMVGFSWGVGIKIKKIKFNYGRAIYHLAGPSNLFSISTNLSDFGKKNLL